MREDGILPRGAGRAPGVGEARRVLVQGHGQVQVLLRRERREMRHSAPRRGARTEPHGGAGARAARTGQPHLVGGQGHNAVQVFHQLLEGGSLRGYRMPAIPHHHVPGTGLSSQGLL